MRRGRVGLEAFLGGRNELAVGLGILQNSKRDFCSLKHV
jgi:hypothetical protein